MASGSLKGPRSVIKSYTKLERRFCNNVTLTLFERNLTYAKLGFWQVWCMFNLTTQQSKVYPRETVKFKKNYSCFETDFWKDFTRWRLTFFLPNNFYIEDFVYILAICEATSVRSSVNISSVECDKVQRLQTHCGKASILGGKSLYKDMLLSCPQWSSGPYISRNFLIWIHFVNASGKKSDLRMHISSTTQGN